MSQGFFHRLKKIILQNALFCLTNYPKLKKKPTLQSFKTEKKSKHLAIFAKQNYSKNESIIDRVGI